MYNIICIITFSKYFFDNIGKKIVKYLEFTKKMASLLNATKTFNQNQIFQKIC